MPTRRARQTRLRDTPLRALLRQLVAIACIALWLQGCAFRGWTLLFLNHRPRVVVWWTGERPSDVVLHYEVHFVTGHRDRGQIALAKALPIRCQGLRLYGDARLPNDRDELRLLAGRERQELEVNRWIPKPLDALRSAPDRRRLAPLGPPIFVARAGSIPGSKPEARVRKARKCNLAIYAAAPNGKSDVYLILVAREAQHSQPLGVGPTNGDLVLLVALLPLYAATLATGYAAGGALLLAFVTYVCVASLGQICPPPDDM